MEIRNQTNSIMKRIVTLFLCMLLLTSIHAQETELTIDNQTPGWLSSKLTYAEQVALKKLTLTGYVNHEDIVFVNKLISNYNLEWLDISDINVLEYGENDYYGFMNYYNMTTNQFDGHVDIIDSKGANELSFYDQMQTFEKITDEGNGLQAIMARYGRKKSMDC